MHEAVIPDLHESGWQNVLEKSPNELKWRKVHGFVGASLGIGVSEQYPTVRHGDDTMI